MFLTQIRMGAETRKGARIIKKKIITILLLIIIFTSIPVGVSARTHIGDEMPATKYQVGNGPDISYELEADDNILPIFHPGWALDQLTWLSYPHTAYYFRNAPSEGSGWFSGAIDDASASIANCLANVTFKLTKFFAYMGNILLLIGFDDFFMRDSLGYIDSFVKNSSNGFLGTLLTLALVGLAIGAGVMIFRGQVMRGLSSVLLGLLCFSGLLIYTANVSSIIPPVLSFFNNLTASAIFAVSGIQDYKADPNNTDSQFDLNIEEADEDLTLLKKSLCNMSNGMWFALVSAPWASGQFGTADYTKLKMTQEEIDQVNEALKPSVFSSEKQKTVRSKTLKSQYIDTNFLASSEDVKEPLLKAITALDIDHGNHPMTTAASGPGSQNADKHSSAAFGSLIPAGAYFVLMVLVGLPVFLAQLAIVILLLLLSVALILGVAGERGRQLMLKYIQWLLSAFSIKVIYGFYLGVTMCLAIMVMHLSGSNIAGADFLLTIIFAAAIWFRKDYFNWAMGLIALEPPKFKMENPLKTFMKYKIAENVLSRKSGITNKGEQKPEKTEQEEKQSGTAKMVQALEEPPATFKRGKTIKNGKRSANNTNTTEQAERSPIKEFMLTDVDELKQRGKQYLKGDKKQAAEEEGDMKETRQQWLEFYKRENRLEEGEPPPTPKTAGVKAAGLVKHGVSYIQMGINRNNEPEQVPQKAEAVVPTAENRDAQQINNYADGEQRKINNMDGVPIRQNRQTEGGETHLTKAPSPNQDKERRQTMESDTTPTSGIMTVSETGPVQDQTVPKSHDGKPSAASKLPAPVPTQVNSTTPDNYIEDEESSLTLQERRKQLVDRYMYGQKKTGPGYRESGAGQRADEAEQSYFRRRDY